VVRSGPRLLIVTTVAATIDGFLLPYARHYRDRGWTVEAAANGATSVPRIVEAFDAVHELPISRSIADVGGMRRSLGTLKELVGDDFDIVHVHTPIASFLTRLSAALTPRGRRPAVMYTAHGFHFHRHGHPLTNLVFAAAEKLAGRWTDRLIVINHEDRAQATRLRIVSPERLVEMPGIGVDTAWFAPERVTPEAVLAVRGRLAIPQGTTTFVLIGELNRNKRPTDVVEALSSMERGDAHLILLGDGPSRSEVLKAIRAAGVERRVHVQGVVDDVRPYIAAADALILASKREGLPRSIMEGLSMAVPVISSTARGSTQLVMPDAGWVVPTGDVSAMARAMDLVARDPDAARAAGLRGRARMIAEYDEAVVVERHDRLYEEVLADRDSRPA
jgi:glycosyltransferase involved in cell wall biosynthesis